MSKSFKLVFLWIVLSCLLLPRTLAQDATTRNPAHFDYDAHAPLDTKEISVEQRNGASIHEISYASPKGGRVPASLVVPEAAGRFAAIVWGHWMMPGSPSANRKEFLDEALALAPAGVVSLLIDAPYVRPGFKADPDPLGPQEPEVLTQQVVDLRRGIDLLLSRRDIDPKRVACVGHSFDSAAAAILDAVDKRLAAFVFMGGPQSEKEYVLSANTPEIVAFRKSVSMSKLVNYLDTYAWTDPATYAASLGPAAALFQYGMHDDFVPVADAKRYFAMCSGPKEIKFYDSSHALSADARRDRFEFLRRYLSLSSLPPGKLESVPQTK